MKKLNLLTAFVCCWLIPESGLNAQVTQKNGPRLTFQHQLLKTDASFRGLHVLNAEQIWCSGSKGTVVSTRNGGKKWELQQISTARTSEFRDVQGFANGSAVVLAAGSPAQVFRYSRNGNAWKETYHYSHEKVFFDAFGFWDAQHGIAFSDPIEDSLYLIRTKDAGKTWSPVESRPETLAHEAGFAASGTCLATYGKNQVWIGLGGVAAKNESKFARVVFSQDRGRTWKQSHTTLSRSESAGVFSIAFSDSRIGFAVGGDYKRPQVVEGNVSLTTDGGQTWRNPKTSSPTGYRSCIAFTKIDSQLILLATGTNGTDLSLDSGESWHRASIEGFHAIAFVPGTSAGWAVGSSGKIASFRLSMKKQLDHDR